MQKTSKLFSLGAWAKATSLGVVLSASFCSNLWAANLPISDQGRWILSEDQDYAYNKDSISHSLTPKEAVPRYSLSINVAQNVINSFTFKVGCMLESATPMFEMRVSGLDIRIFDSINDFVFARFMVDDNQEYSLRGEIMSSDRILFLPSTHGQDKNLSDLFLQMREGGVLKIGLLQGENDRVREYEVPLAGFMQYSDQILQSCQNYHQYSTDPVQFLPDYMTKEPDGYAPKNFSLKQMDAEVIDPNAPAPVPVEVEVQTPKPEVQAPPEILPFAPDGGPASIGPDGRPIGAGSHNVNGNQSFGQAQGPMQIGPDGRPVAPAAPAGAGTATAPAAGTAPAPSAGAGAGTGTAGAGAGAGAGTGAPAAPATQSSSVEIF